MRRAVRSIAVAASVTALAGGCTVAITQDGRPDYTDDVRRAFAMAERHQLPVAAITQEHWSRLENSTGALASRVQHASAPGNRFFAPVFRAIARTDKPRPQRFRQGMTNNCAYFPVGTSANPANTEAVARICLDHRGHIFGTWWRALER